MPKKKVPRTTVRLPEGVHQKAKVAAAESKVSLQAFVAEAVLMRLRAEEDGPKRKRVSGL